MFNHLYNKHNTEFSNAISKDWLDQAEEDSPLMFWWYYTDDFDEEKQVKLYGCLATKKTFTSEERALLHFKRSPESKKLHNKELAKLKKQVKKNKTTKVQPATDNPFKKALASKDPCLARAFYSRYLYLLPLCKTAVESLLNMYQVTYPINTGETDGSGKSIYFTVPQIKEKFDYLQKEVDKLITKKELDPEPLYKLFTKFEQIITIAKNNLDQGSVYCTKRSEDDEYGLIAPTPNEFYVGNPAYPQVDF